MKFPALKHCVVGALCCATSVALAQNPFAGTWKVNYDKSHITGETLSFTHGAGGAVIFKADAQSYSFKLDGSAGKDPFGDTEHWTKVDDHTWKQETQAGPENVTNTWTLSADGKTIDNATTGTKPNGDPINESETFTRVTPGKTFFGTWKSTKISENSPDTTQIDANGKNGIVWHIPEMKAYVDLNFDGKESSPVGPTVPKGLTLSATKTGPRSFTLVEKLNGKLLFHGHYSVSADGKTMTEIGHPAGSTVATKVVFEKS